MPQAPQLWGKIPRYTLNREIQAGPRVWSGPFIVLSYFKMRHYFQTELLSNIYAFDINLVSRGSSVNDVTCYGLVDRLAFLAKLKIFLLLHGQR